MALIDCPECKKEISDQAPSCPYCGIVFTKADPTVPEPVVELEPPTFTESDPAPVPESSRKPDWLIALGVFWGAGSVTLFVAYPFFSLGHLLYVANPWHWFQHPLWYLQDPDSEWNANSSFLLESLPLLVATTASVFVFYKRRAHKAKDSELL